MHTQSTAFCSVLQSVSAPTYFVNIKNNISKSDAVAFLTVL